MALQPVLLDGRTGCRVLYQNGAVEDVRHLPEYVLEHIAHEKMRTTLKALREIYRKVKPGEKIRQIPILFSESRIFVPITMPVHTKHDSAQPAGSAQGYISLMDYETLHKDPAGPLHISFLKGKVQLPCSYQMEAVAGLLNRAQEYRNDYIQYMEQEQTACSVFWRSGQFTGRHVNLQDCASLPQMVAEKLTPNQYCILQVLLRQPDLTYEELMDSLDLTYRQVADGLVALRTAEILYRVGSCKNGYWEPYLWVKEALEN